jgi:polygalacturonase
MKLISRTVLVGLVSLNIAVAFQGASLSVATYGAQCDRVTDDRAAIQAALDAAAAAGGGTVTLPGSTCLLNSFAPSSHPWDFYNLHVPSGVTLQGVTGSTLLQGPGGRQSISNIPRATWIENTVITVGNDYATIHFQHSGNGGFYSLQAMTVGSPSVRLTTAAQVANFAAGDYVAIYEYTSGDVLPAQMTQVTGVNAAFGDLTLADRVIRPFSAPRSPP